MIDWLACALVRIVGWLVCHLPPSLCVWIGETLGAASQCLQPKRVRIGLGNLKAAFGDRLSPAEYRRIVRRIFKSLGAGVIEMLRLPACDAAYVDRYIAFDRFDRLESAITTGRPVVLLTAHFGNWELSSIASAINGHPIVALARAQDKFPRLYRLLVSYRELKGCRIVHKGSAMRQVVQALKRRELVGIVGDQATRRGIPIDFFGRPAFFATGPFELARSTNALIAPAFIHRVRGPFHRLVIEPPIDLAEFQGTKDDVVRAGLERFAEVLRRRIEQDPAQWLWLHKRWKHTPARRVVVLSDGKLGHVKQSMAVVQAMKDQSPVVREQVIDVRYRNRLGRIVAGAWAAAAPSWAPSSWLTGLVLEPACARQVATAYADIVVSCGSSTAPITLMLSRQLRAKSVILMNPTPVPLRRFDVALVPIHDRVRAGANVVHTYGALTGLANGQLANARQRLESHPRWRAPSGQGPVIAVLIGGDTPDYQVTVAFVQALTEQVIGACDALKGACLVTTSRRTPRAVEEWLSERLTGDPRCRLLLLASRDPLDGTLAGMLGWADVAVVTGESISMVSESCASGRYVVAVEPPVRPLRRYRRHTKAWQYMRALAAEGYALNVPPDRLGLALHHVLTDRPPIRRLETDSTVRNAVKRVL